jgi:hypothetical protein
MFQSMPCQATLDGMPATTALSSGWRDDQGCFRTFGTADDGEASGIDFGLRLEPIEGAVEGFEGNALKLRRLARGGEVRDL